MLFPIRSEGLATKTKFPTNRASDSPNSDPSKEYSKTKEGKINLALLVGNHGIFSVALGASLLTKIGIKYLESPNSSPATVGINEGPKEYYSLKMHREGPNSESGELNPDSESKQVKSHNKATANRYEKR